MHTTLAMSDAATMAAATASHSGDSAPPASRRRRALMFAAGAISFIAFAALWSGSDDGGHFVNSIAQTILRHDDIHARVRPELHHEWKEYALRAGLAAMRGLNTDELYDAAITLSTVRLAGLSAEIADAQPTELAFVTHAGSGVHALPHDAASIMVLLARVEAWRPAAIVGRAQGPFATLLAAYLARNPRFQELVVVDTTGSRWVEADAAEATVASVTFLNTTDGSVLAQLPDTDAVLLDGSLPVEVLQQYFRSIPQSTVRTVVIHGCGSEAPRVAGGKALWASLQAQLQGRRDVALAQLPPPPPPAPGALPDVFEGVCVVRFASDAATPAAIPTTGYPPSMAAVVEAATSEGPQPVTGHSAQPSPSPSPAPAAAQNHDGDLEDILAEGVGGDATAGGGRRADVLDGVHAKKLRRQLGTAVRPVAIRRAQAVAAIPNTAIDGQWNQPRLRASLAAIRGMTMLDLHDIRVMVKVVRHVGLNFDVRDIYGADKRYMLPAQGGNGLWQIPLEFTSLMVLYSRFKIKTFYDVGPLYGYTSSLFTAYLSRFDETMILTSIDYYREWRDAEEAMRRMPSLHYVAPATTADYRNQHADAVFIDGDHRYTSARDDYYRVGLRAKIVAFHDCNDQIIYRQDTALQGGVKRLWLELKEQHAQDPSVTLLEMVYHPNKNEYFGICAIFNSSNLGPGETVDLAGFKAIAPPTKVISDGRVFDPIPLLPL